MSMDPTHRDILTTLDRLEKKVDDNIDRLKALEAEARERAGALRLGKWLIWFLLGLGGFAASVIELLKHLRN